MHTKRIHELMASGTPPTIGDVWWLLVEVSERLEEVELVQKEHCNAFLKNDLGKPDIDGHRKAHSTLMEAARLVTDYKISGTKALITAVIVFVLGLTASGFVDRYLTPMAQRSSK